MGPSAPLPELDSTACPDGIGLLDEIERRWRDALSLVAADEPQAAAHEIERAGEILHHLGRLDEAAELVAPEALAAFSERMQRLSRLHHELVAASRRAQATIGRTLAQAHDGRAALRAYGPVREPDHSCDQIV